MYDRPFYNSSRQGTLLKAKGSVWHKSSIEKGIVPCPAGIDTDARWWGYSHTIKEGWVFGYKLHLTCTIGELVGTSNSQCYCC